MVESRIELPATEARETVSALTACETEDEQEVDRVSEKEPLAPRGGRMNERCYYCGSWAITERPGGELACKDCGTTAPGHFFRSGRHDERHLDELNNAYCGMTVARKDGPPDTRSPFVRKVMAEMRVVGRPWLEFEEEIG